jgi:hypothetical protein
MGNLPCPMPADYKHQHSHLMYAIRIGKTVEWIEEELGKCREWHERKGILRTNWNTVLLNWLRKAVEFELQQEAGRRAYGVVNGHIVAGQPVVLARDPDRGVSGLDAKIATYHKFLKTNMRMAAEYLERQPERVRRAILDSVCS